MLPRRMAVACASFLMPMPNKNCEQRQALVPMAAVADIEYTSSYSSIKRKNLDRMITIYSNVLEGYNANLIVEELKQVMDEYPMPEGFTYEFTGEQQQQAEDMGFLNIQLLA